MGFIKETKKARGELASPLAMIQILLLGIGLLTEAFLNWEWNRLKVFELSDIETIVLNQSSYRLPLWNGK